MQAHSSDPSAEPFADARTPLLPQRLADPLCLLAVMLIAGIGVATRLRIGWVPSDEGTLATSALHVLQGQLPQRDFAEIYTGGLSLLHALAFRLFGTNLFSLRLCVFIFFLAWLPAVFRIARRFLSPVWSAVLTLTAVVWSYPNYVAAMPSWYNLFFATFGSLALLRFLENRSSRWLVLAGIFGGISILIKIIGLYYVAAVLLFLLFLEQDLDDNTHTTTTTPRTYRLTCAALLFLFLTILTRMVWPQLHTGEALHFLLPSYTCVAILLLRERRTATRTSSRRFADLISLIGPFLLGVTLPVTLFATPYLLSHSLGALIQGVAASITLRLGGIGGREQAPGLGYTIYGLVTMTLIRAAFAPWARDRKVLAAIAAGLAAILACSALPSTLQDTWYMAGTLTPLACLAGAVLLLSNRIPTTQLTPLDRQRIMLFLALSALCALVQFPFPYVTYFCFCAPLTLLCVLACVSVRRPNVSQPLLAILLVFFLDLGLFGVVLKHIYNPDLQPRSLQALQSARSGALLVDPNSARIEQLIPFLRQHSPNGLLYAGNDCPELYFLSGLTNPTRDDTGAPDTQVIAAIRSGHLRLVAVNDHPFFPSSVVSPALRFEVSRLLPQATTIAGFTVYWSNQ